ncbi:MAG TPA: hydrogenase accessory protein HypB [Deltaproteobacteria bacterium]|nr:MAG: hydrogenase accessory protein HypB [Deltaproteobacteria bacterium GWA2_55_82]OGQ64155.1 MAG: hydrogenase accessory protein HypB [Deltaproteobacteria bacterium RIFCSPLOWO2_02_FULL_55_12]OIJ74608.1 MAG: hydrogenase accessory protein HypB [Deltaproteobacteria bacterium GWC2_55_46]HBG46449.1 hydrogenase accessory protein HypB [Deltaproteobacteria bacterium]HCY10661.1 hydrogenase accessory protein HypB [Deltaproteobacteria bacterium]
MHEILIEEKILAKNDEIAAENRKALARNNIYTINIVSAPGAGKTSLIERMAAELGSLGVRFAVVEGDLEGDFDSRRIERHGIPALQITTGRACHLDAHQISHALPWVFERPIDLLVIENVGNMVCPAEYDLGEDMMVTVMSTTEGDDKPLKYPAIFSASEALIINKTDLAPHTDFDIDRARENALKVNPYLKIFETSCRTGAGVSAWAGYLAGLVRENGKQDG